jgi:import inner membrane translocase subunit TIM17
MRGAGRDHTRDPCPYVIVYDTGIGFALGAVLGGIANTWKGYKNAPRGDRLPAIISGVKSRAPVLAGNFAVWSGLFNAFDCGFHHWRGKEDAWNSVLAGGATGALLSARAGPTAMIVSGLFGGVFLAAIEGAGVVFNKFGGQSFDPQPYPEPEAPKNPQPSPNAESPQNGASLFKGTFGFKN